MSFKKWVNLRQKQRQKTVLYTKLLQLNYYIQYTKSRQSFQFCKKLDLLKHRPNFDLVSEKDCLDLEHCINVKLMEKVQILQMHKHKIQMIGYGPGIVRKRYPILRVFYVKSVCITNAFGRKNDAESEIGDLRPLFCN